MERELVERELTNGARALLAGVGREDNEAARLLYLQEDRYVVYPRAEMYLNRMRRLLDAPHVLRPANLIVVGETNNGKSALVREFVRQYAAPVDDPNEAAARIPALYVLLKSDVDEDRLYHWILNALLAAYKDKDRPDKKFRMVSDLFERLSIRMLVLDEFHHIMTATGARQRRCLNTIKTLGSELQIPIVATAIPQVFTLLRSDPQIHNRFEALALPRWKYGPEFRGFLAGLETDLPLLHPSGLDNPALARRIYDLSEGLLGEAVELLGEVAVQAVGKEERITLEGIEALNPVPPSLRDAEVERQLFGLEG